MFGPKNARQHRTTNIHPPTQRATPRQPTSFLPTGLSGHKTPKTQEKTAIKTCPKNTTCHPKIQNKMQTKICQKNASLDPQFQTHTFGNLLETSKQGLKLPFHEAK